jgi:uncharacterized protein (TIGR00266 family)
MEHTINHRPSYAMLDLTLSEEEAIRSEAGAMVSHSPTLDIQTKAEGGILKSLSRSVFGGESFFMNTFTATADDTTVQLAPALSGDVKHHRLDDETLYVQSTSFLAADPAVDIDTEFGGAKTFFGGEGLFLLNLTGTGDTFLSSYGAIDSVTIEDGDTYIVDTGHIVAFEDSLSFDVRRVGGLRSTLLSGEGLVCEFSGEGTVWTQSRSPDAFLAWLIPQIPSRNTTQ